MTDRLTLTGAGLVLHDDHGHQLAALTIVQADGETKLVTTGAWPAEVTLPREASKHLVAVLGRADRAALFASTEPPRVPRRTGYPVVCTASG